MFCFHEVASDCPLAPSNPADRRTNKSLLKVASFNAEWLFYGTPSANCPGTGCPWTTQDMALEHMQHIASVIREVNADILTVVEVQSCDVLKVLVDQYLGGMGYLPYLVQGTDTATGQNVGLLTRVDPSVNLQRTANRVSYPVSGNQCGYTGSNGDYGVSKHYWTTFQLSNYAKPITLFGIHLLAFPTRNDRCAQREAQATVIQRAVLAEAIQQGHEVIITGDYNDYDGVVLDVSDDAPISRVLQILKSPAGLANGPTLSSAASFVTDPQRYTSWYDMNNNCVDDGGKEHTSIDHVLFSSGLASLVSNASTNHVFTAGCAAVMSDHWPVSVTFDLTKSTIVPDDNQGNDRGDFSASSTVASSRSLVAAAVLLAFVASIV